MVPMFLSGGIWLTVTPGGTNTASIQNVTINFAKVKVNYVEQTTTGGAGAKPQMGWNIAENVKL